MIALITGLDRAGFVGPHLARLLKDHGQTAVPLQLDGKFVDLRDPEQVERAVDSIRPDRVYHLAAQSSVGKSFKEPELTFNVNVKGTEHLLAGLHKHAPKSRLLFISTGAVYGSVEQRQEYQKTLAPERRSAFIADPDHAFREDDLLHPGNPYAQSKQQAEKICLRFFQEQGLDARIVRPLGHTGPGQQLGFVVPDMASQVAAIAAGEFPPIVRAGRLDVAREFSDVRDVVRAYLTIMEEGEPGQTYNLAANEPHTIEQVITTLLRLAGIQARLFQDTDRLRPGKDESTPRLDAAKLFRLGFYFQIPFQQTLADILHEWIGRIKAGQALGGPADADGVSSQPH